MKGYHMGRKQKAQVKFDFIVGFFLFTVVVVYISFSVIQSFPKYIAQAADNDMRLQAWKASDKFMQFSEKNGAIDVNALENFSSCFHYNYNNITSRNNYADIKSILNVTDLRDLHLTFDILLFGITTTGNNNLRNGSTILQGVHYNISIQNTSNYFDEVSVDGGPWSNTSVDIGAPPEPYDILKIDYDGEFVIFRKRMVDCGPNVPSLAPNSVVRRYSTYNRSVAMAELTYW